MRAIPGSKWKALSRSDMPAAPFMRSDGSPLPGQQTSIGATRTPSLQVTPLRELRHTARMPQPSADADDWLVACLCAQWCGTCCDYRLVFDALARAFAAKARFVWVDIEDDEAALGEADVEDFPTLLIARAGDILFFGPVTPHPSTAERLVQRALEGDLPGVQDARLEGLPGRVRGLAA